MKKNRVKSIPIKLVLILFFVSLNAFSQYELSVPFTAGFIGAKGSNDAQANVIKTFTTLGISKAFFMQNSSSATAFDVVSTNVLGTLRLQLNSGQLIDIPGSIKWKNSGGTTNYLGFIPSASFSSVSFSYGAGLTFIIYGGTTTTSNIGLGLIGKSTSDFVDGSNVSGNSSGFAADINSYLTTTNLASNKPSGPVTVSALTTADTTPTITGTVTLISGESLSIDVNNLLYTTANGLSIVGTDWSLPINTALALGTYSVVAKITSSAGYTLNDATSNEVVIIGTPVVVTSSGTSSANTITVYGNVTSDNGSSVSERGFVYSLTSNPTTSNAKVVSGSGTGIFSKTINGLTLSTTYYVRAYAINSAGTSYGAEMSFTTAAICGGNIIGSGYGTNPISAMALDSNWKIVTLPQGYSYSETLPYNAYVPKTTSLAPVYLDVNGYTVSGSTYYWIAPKADASELIGGGAYYNWIVQQTFTVAQSGFYDLNFSGMGDNAISFFINGVIDTTDPVKPKITGGTQIGTRFDSFTSMGTFSGVTYLNAGVNTASMVMEDWGGATTALISGSTFTCNTSYINVNPSISAISYTTMVEGTTPTPITFTVNDLETPLNNLTVTASSSNTELIPNSNIVLQGATGSRTITLTPILGQTGTSIISVTVDDNSGGVVTSTFVVAINPLSSGLTKWGSYSTDFTQMISKNGAVGSGIGFSRKGIIFGDKTGLSPQRAASSALQIKRDFPLSPDGIYWIKNSNINGGVPFQVYADMTTDGGGWMLLNVGSGSSGSSQVNTVTSPNVQGYLPRTTVIELAKLSTDVQLRSGASSTSYANKATSNSPLAIEALRSSSTVAGGLGTWHSNSLNNILFTANTGSWCWSNCCTPDVTGWPQMYHSNNYSSCVHWYADLALGRKASGTDAWFSTWIR